MFPWLLPFLPMDPARYPLSGDVRQAINPWSWMMPNSTWGLINIVMGRPGNARAESEVLEGVGSYGQQIGRLADAVDVLLSTIDVKGLTAPQAAAVYAFREQLDAVRATKSRVTNRKYPDLSSPPAPLVRAAPPVQSAPPSVKS